MQVESFAVEEVVNARIEDVACARELARQLGLEGQERFYEEGKPVNPYRKATAKELLVYRTLFTQKTELERYSDGPVPLRVLQIAAHAKEVLGCTLIVLHPSNADIKDPVLIGEVGDWRDKKTYLLARWGDALEEFSVLAGYAVERLKKKAMSDLVEAQEKLAMSAENMSLRVEHAFEEGRAISAYASVS